MVSRNFGLALPPGCPNIMPMIRLLAAAIVAAGLGCAPPAVARQDDARLDGLFTRLQATANAGEADLIQRAIWRLWTLSGSETVDLLMNRGAGAMARGDYEAALDVLDRVVDLDADFAEGWNRRATLFYLMGEYKASVADVERTLRLEPRHFGALSGLGLIYSALEDDERALKAYRKALEVNPHLRGARAAVILLKRKLEGEGI